MRQIIGVVALVAASVMATPSLAAMSAANPAFLQNPVERPKKVVLLPPQVFVYELSAGGVPTRMADWEAAARANLSTTAARLAQDTHLFELLPAPPLASTDLDQLDAHIGLYDRVAQSVFVYGRGDMHELAPGEKSLWQEADEFDRALARAGRLNADPVLSAYLQGIMDRLYPEFKDKLRVRLLNAQHINAFALPNGSIYVNAGLVARFENEAQLATVLAHEGAHFTHRHSLQQAERVRNAAAFALVVGMLGVPLVGDIVALSSMFGYSREHEREADEIGYRRLLAAGYAPRESIRRPRSRPPTSRSRSFLPAIPSCRSASTASANW